MMRRIPFILGSFFALAVSATPRVAANREYVQSVEDQLKHWDNRAVRLQAEAQALPDSSARQRELTQDAEYINESTKEIRGELAEIAAAPAESKEETVMRVDRELRRLRQMESVPAE